MAISQCTSRVRFIVERRIVNEEESKVQTGRGNWNSRLGFILAAAGSAIGLGNIWRFPYTAGENGGGAFVLLYLIFVFLIGVPVLLAELSMGRASERSAVGAFKKLVPSGWWPAVGGLGVITGFGILSFYSVIAGWTLQYLFLSIKGTFQGTMTVEASGPIFAGIASNGPMAILLTGLFLLLTVLVVRGGISGGIERAAKILMPLFLVVLVALVVRSLTLEGASQGIHFLFDFDFSKLSRGAVVSALGQALFSLSIGMGAMITYGSYLPKDVNLPVSGFIVALFDTAIALIGGLIIFPALFSAGASPDGGPGLVFVIMPTIFAAMGGAGQLFGIAFYLLLAVAALTSTISLLEVIVTYFVDERRWSREKASWILGGLCFVLAVPSALSQGAVKALSAGPDSNFPGGDFLSLANIIFGNYCLSIGAIFICLFVGWKWGVKNAIAEMSRNGVLPAASFWSFMVRFICPLAVLLVLIYAALTNSYL